MLWWGCVACDKCTAVVGGGGGASRDPLITYQVAGETDSSVGKPTSPIHLPLSTSSAARPFSHEITSTSNIFFLNSINP